MYPNRSRRNLAILFGIGLETWGEKAFGGNGVEAYMPVLKKPIKRSYLRSKPIQQCIFFCKAPMCFYA